MREAGKLEAAATVYEDVIGQVAKDDRFTEKQRDAYRRCERSAARLCNKSKQPLGTRRDRRRRLWQMRPVAAGAGEVGLGLIGGRTAAVEIAVAVGLCEAAAAAISGAVHLPFEPFFFLPLSVSTVVVMPPDLTMWCVTFLNV